MHYAEQYEKLYHAQENFAKPFNHSLILTGCSLCCDPFYYNWEALRHPGQLERFGKRKLTHSTPKSFAKSPFPPPQHVTEDFISEMYLMKFQIYILLK